MYRVGVRGERESAELQVIVVAPEHEQRMAAIARCLTLQPSVRSSRDRTAADVAKAIKCSHHTEGPQLQA